MATRTKSQGIHSRAQSRAFGYLQRKHREAYDAYRAEAEDEAGGCLKHHAWDCPLPEGEHRPAYLKAKFAARYAALSRLRDEDYASYLEAYDGEVEYEREKLSAG